MHQRLVRGSEQNSGKRPVHMSRYQGLHRAIEHTREQIADYQGIVSRLQQQFDAVVRPLEQSMTSAVLQLTHELIDHHDRKSLSYSDKSVLGLWVSDNITSLSEHPFAEKQAVQQLALRWRESLRAEAAGAVPPGLDRMSSALRNRPHAQSDTRADDAAERSTEYRDTEEPMGDTRDTSADETASEQADSKEPGRTPPASTNGKHAVEIRALMAQLFRQLAAVLHPDREPDDNRKQAKDALMSQCLKARERGDLATLLSLHTEHVGGDELLSSTEMNRLVDSLEIQLRALQTRLRQLRFGNTLQTMMIERYNARTDQDTAARFAHHASSLQDEIERLQHLKRSLGTPAGLDQALEQRRDILLDRMAINEMTGL